MQFGQHFGCITHHRLHRCIINRISTTNHLPVLQPPNAPMSAFAALNRLSNKSSESLLYNANLSGTITSSNVTLGPKNAIFMDSAVLVGLKKDEFIMVDGFYDLSVVKGCASVNNLFKISSGNAYPVVTSKNESLPVICGLESEESTQTGVLPSYSTVIKLSNLDTGLQNFGVILPHLQDLYYSQPSSPYTFEVVESPRNNVVGLRVDQKAHYAITEVSGKLRSQESRAAIVVGASFCGRLTFAALLVSNMLLAGVQRVALIDLDPSSPKFTPTGCIGLTFHSQVSIGVHLQTHDSNDKLHFYGHEDPAVAPSHYFRCMESLKKHYISHWKSIPLIVITPGNIRGFGRETLAHLFKVFGDLEPSLIYLSHNNYLSIGDFEPDEFEVQDNPDDEVLADLTYKTVYKLDSTRRKPKYLGILASEIAILQYFHRISRHHWDFSSFLLELAPLILSFTPGNEFSVPLIASLHEPVKCLNESEMQTFIEASVVALCAIDVPKSSLHSYPQFINTTQLLHLDCTFICLCIVHSINLKEGYFLVYLPKDQNLSGKLLRATAKGHTLALVRGTGFIPSGEIFASPFIGKKIPFVNREPTNKIGGIWNARRNLGRKNQRS